MGSRNQLYSSRQPPLWFLRSLVLRDRQTSPNHDHHLNCAVAYGFVACIVRPPRSLVSLRQSPRSYHSGLSPPSMAFYLRPQAFGQRAGTRTRVCVPDAAVKARSCPCPFKYDHKVNHQSNRLPPSSQSAHRPTRPVLLPLQVGSADDRNSWFRQRGSKRLQRPALG